MKWFQNFTLLYNPSESERIRAGRAGGALFIVLGLTTLGILPLLTRFGARESYISIGAFVTLAVGVVLLVLPWGKVPYRANAIASIGAFVVLAYFEHWIGQAYFFIPTFYMLVFLYIGLLQDPRLILMDTAVAIATTIPLFSDSDLRKWVGIGILGNITGFMVAFALIYLRANQEMSSRLSSWLIESLAHVGNKGDSKHTMDYACSRIDDLMSPCGVVALAKGGAQNENNQLLAMSFLGQESKLRVEGALLTRTEDPAFAEAAKSNTTLFIPDARTSKSDLGAAEEIGYVSALYVPFSGPSKLAGTMGIYWEFVIAEPTKAVVRSLEIFCNEAARVIATRFENEDLSIKLNSDELTKLYNRRSFFQAIETLVSGDSLVFLDLDHFKVLNDTLGHQEGDAELQLFGEHLREVVRENDLPCRYGGEEFAVILKTCSDVEAKIFVERLRQSWAGVGRVTFSAGIATMSPTVAPAGLLLAADRAMYIAKAQGRNTTVVSPDESSAQVRRTVVDAGFRSAG